MEFAEKKLPGSRWAKGLAELGRRSSQAFLRVLNTILEFWGREKDMFGIQVGST